MKSAGPLLLRGSSVLWLKVGMKPIEFLHEFEHSSRDICISSKMGMFFKLVPDGLILLMLKFKHMYDEVRSQGYTMVPHSTTYVNPFYIWHSFLVLFPFSTLFPEYVLFCLVDKREIERVIFPTPPCALSKSFSNSYELGGEKDN